jgi:DNA mismatch repair protein MutS
MRSQDAAVADEPQETTSEAAPSSAGAPTPMLRQYLELKARHPDALLFFRLGDFYELFFEDARQAAELLGITLTSRPKGEERIPMCGVPHHSARLHIARLVEAGLRVAICDQVEEATPGKTLVRREVTRVVTPGTFFDDEGREAKAASFLAGLVLAAERGGALALLEATTGDFRVFVAETDSALFEELSRVEPREVLLTRELAESPRVEALAVPGTRTFREAREFEARRGQEALCRHFQVGSLDGFGLSNQPEAWAAAAAVLRYVEETQRSALAHVQQVVRYEPSGALLIDAASRRNLDLVRNSADGRRAGSLLATIDRTVTSMGGRLLSQWLLYPLTEVEAIHRRQEAVAELVESAVLREDLTGGLREVGDLERLVGRLVVKQGTARDARLLGQSLRQLPVVEQLVATRESALLREVATGLPDLSGLAALLEQAIVDEPPATTRDGGMFRRGYSVELDELLELAATGKDFIARMEADERRRTGIQSLKIRFNRVFGYYIEVTKANLQSVPADYVRKQTTANGERYVTPALQEYEGKVLTAQERSVALEQRLFEELRERIVGEAPRVLRAAKLLATLDVLLSFSRVAADHDYRRPTVNSGDLLRILDGRHPVVERSLGRDPFVPNDVELDHDHRLVVLTGPNMAGKSTAMRQVALVTILAQMGSFVPAREAVVGVCDRIFTRVGAGDDLARGQSTFMVEMSETANILRHATSRSLVLLDEIGRGTSTFDGLAIAWAVAEHIHDVVRGRTIFATHYHELTQLAHEREHVVNLTMAVREWQDRVLFLRKLVPGAASRSYGIQVARLAGVPAPVLARAREVLSNLEKAGTDESGQPVFARAGRRHARAQLALGFGAASPAAAASPGPGDAIVDELARLEVDALSPLQALQLLHRWKGSLGGPSGPVG